jgi:hypothetical protein
MIEFAFFANRCLTRFALVSLSIRIEIVFAIRARIAKRISLPFGGFDDGVSRFANQVSFLANSLNVSRLSEETRGDGARHANLSVADCTVTLLCVAAVKTGQMHHELVFLSLADPTDPLAR